MLKIILSIKGFIIECLYAIMLLKSIRLSPPLTIKIGTTVPNYINTLHTIISTERATGYTVHVKHRSLHLLLCSCLYYYNALLNSHPGGWFSPSTLVVDCRVCDNLLVTVQLHSIYRTTN